MLVLTRKQGEGILIGGDIAVTVISIDGDKVRIGIQAPKNVRVIREELTAEFGQENRMQHSQPFFSLNIKHERKNEIGHLHIPGDYKNLR